MEGEGNTSVDIISLSTGIRVNRLSAMLLELELRGLIESLPGNCYRIIR
jgi:predicted Rossmann fold nucleotide-binding protein DprA/Smf involved in DNA uptake